MGQSLAVNFRDFPAMMLCELWRYFTDGVVGWRRLLPAVDRHLPAGQFAAEFGEFQERNARLQAAAHIIGRSVPQLRPLQLETQQLEQVGHMQQIPDLLTKTAISEVRQVALEEMLGDPEGDQALVDLAHLPRSGENPAAVDQHRKQWILIHVEVRSQEEPEFLVRRYIYNYRTFDSYNRKVGGRSDCYTT